MKQFALLTFITLFLTVSGCKPETHSPETVRPTRWEYQSILYKNYNENGVHVGVEDLNKMGREGWELVSVVENESNFDGQNTSNVFHGQIRTGQTFYAILKRPLP
jgi:hypothetical protein